MDFTLPGASGVRDELWTPVAVAIAVVWLVSLALHLARRRADAARLDALAAAARAAARPRAAAAADERPRPLLSLAAACQDVSAARDRTSLAAALASAVDGVFDPSQAMVFVAAGDDRREFVLAATAGRRAAAWPVGARLSDTMGRVGLVARRRVVMDEREFAAQPQLVRDQVESTEPSAFRCEIAAPVVVGDVVFAIVSVGGSRLPFNQTRDALALLASHASVTLRTVEAATDVNAGRESAPAAPR